MFWFGFLSSRWQTIRAAAGSRRLGTQQAEMRLMLSQTGLPLCHRSSGTFPGLTRSPGSLQPAMPQPCPHARGQRDVQSQRSVQCVDDSHRTLTAVCDNIRVSGCTSCLWGRPGCGRNQMGVGGGPPARWLCSWQWPRRERRSSSEVICSLLWGRAWAAAARWDQVWQPGRIQGCGTGGFRVTLPGRKRAIC